MVLPWMWDVYIFSLYIVCLNNNLSVLSIGILNILYNIVSHAEFHSFFTELPRIGLNMKLLFPLQRIKLKDQDPEFISSTRYPTDSRFYFWSLFFQVEHTSTLSKPCNTWCHWNTWFVFKKHISETLKGISLFWFAFHNAHLYNCARGNPLNFFQFLKTSL